MLTSRNVRDLQERRAEHAPDPFAPDAWLAAAKRLAAQGGNEGPLWDAWAARIETHMRGGK